MNNQEDIRLVFGTYNDYLREDLEEDEDDEKQYLIYKGPGKNIYISYARNSSFENTIPGNTLNSIQEAIEDIRSIDRGNCYSSLHIYNVYSINAKDKDENEFELYVSDNIKDIKDKFPIYKKNILGKNNITSIYIKDKDNNILDI